MRRKDSNGMRQRAAEFSEQGESNDAGCKFHFSQQPVLWRLSLFELLLFGTQT